MRRPAARNQSVFSGIAEAGFVITRVHGQGP
jgi:hypothetical protein